MSAFNVTFRMPFEKARDETAFGHICGTGDESHAWNPPADHIVGLPVMLKRIVLFAMLTFKAVVVSATEITDVGGAIGIAIVSLTASGRNSYVAPGTFAWTNVAPSRVTENRGCVSVNWYGQSPVDRLSELTGRHTPSHRWNVGSWCISTVPSGLTMRSQPGPYVTDWEARGWASGRAVPARTSRGITAKTTKTMSKAAETAKRRRLRSSREGFGNLSERRDGGAGLP